VSLAVFDSSHQLELTSSTCTTAQGFLGRLALASRQPILDEGMIENYEFSITEFTMRAKGQLERGIEAFLDPRRLTRLAQKPGQCSPKKGTGTGSDGKPSREPELSAATGTTQSGVEHLGIRVFRCKGRKPLGEFEWFKEGWVDNFHAPQSTAFIRKMIREPQKPCE